MTENNKTPFGKALEKAGKNPSLKDLEKIAEEFFGVEILTEEEKNTKKGNNSDSLKKD